MITLFGRNAETAELARLIGKAAMAGQAIVLVGEPGIGKTALLGAAGELARAGGFEVLTATGVESESQFPFAGLHQVLRSVLGATKRISAAHRRALLTAFGLTDGPSPELYLIALSAVRTSANDSNCSNLDVVMRPPGNSTARKSTGRSSFSSGRCSFDRIAPPLTVRNSAAAEEGDPCARDAPFR